MGTNLQRERAQSRLAPETVDALVRAALQAPSADNRQPFLVETGADFVRLWPRPGSTLTSNARCRAVGLLSVGAAVENLEQRAAALGLESSVEWHLAVGHGPLMTASFRPAAVRPSLADALERRHTNRRLWFRGPRLTPAQREELTGDAAAAQAELTFVDGPRARLAVTRLAWLAESERFVVEHLHAELFRGANVEAGWEAGAEEGIPLGALEVEALVRPFFLRLRSFSVARALALLGGHRWVGLRAAALPCLLAPELAVLSVPAGSSGVTVARCGAALQRVWLRATSWGLAAQPLAAAGVLALEPGADDVDGGARPSVRHALQRGWEALLPGRTPLMVLRLGRAAAPRLVAGRRTVAAATRPEEETR